jgi:hypothetical protein
MPESTRLYYRWDMRAFRPGDSIPPGNWGAWTFRLGPPRKVRPHVYGGSKFFYREYVFEQIRLVEFPHAPSRVESSFAFLDVQAALRWSGQADIGSLYEVEEAQGGTPSAVLDMEHVSALNDCRDFVCVQDMIRAYWSGVCTPRPTMELVTTRDLIVRGVRVPDPSP